MPIRKHQQKNIVLGTLLIALTCLLVFLVAYEKRDALHRMMDRFALIPKTEPLTELYFNNHTKLPNDISIGKKEQFSFSVGNHEGKNVDYTYAVTYTPLALGDVKNGVRSIATGTLSLSSGMTTTTSVFFQLKDRKDIPGVMVVELQDRSERIHFLIKQ